MSLLADILRSKAAELETLRATPRAETSRAPIDVVHALRREQAAPLRLIAEVKLRSPSAGSLSRALGPDERALAYAEAGAAMVSVLCDAPYFAGSWAHVTAARERLDRAKFKVPVLAKEFVIDERQIQEARDRGADAVLLIVRIVPRGRLVELARAARQEGIEPVIEVVDERELDAAVEARARIVGVNARDLDTLQIDPARTARVLAAVPREAVAVHFSGVRSGSDVAVVARHRADAALVGEALMREEDPRELLASMVRAAAGAPG